MRFKGVLENIFKLEVGEDGRTVERILQYTGQTSDEDNNHEVSREWIQRLYHISEENVVGKVVNVGTVGHVDHGRRGHNANPADYASSVPHVRSYYNPFKPECIYWWEGLIYVGGRIIHNLRIHEVDNLAAGGNEEDLIANFNERDDNDIQPFLARLKKGAGKTIPPEVLKTIENFMSPQPMKVQPAFIEREFQRDRRTVVPTRKAIAWAFQLLVWNEDAMKKMAGIGKQDVYVRYEAPPFPGSKHDKLTDEGKWDV